MAKKKKRQEESGGVPEWMVTYGDMMTLLLCFFVLLFSMSEIKKEETFLEVVQSLKKAFGHTSSIGVAPTHKPVTVSVIPQLKRVMLKQQVKSRGDSQIKGTSGIQTTVEQIRDGVQIRLGGPVAFEENSAELQPEVRLKVREIADVVRGHTSTIEIRGHCTKGEGRDPALGFGPDELGFMRAKAVKDALVEDGINPGRVTIMTAGDARPLARDTWDPSSQAQNRRVEIIVNESTVYEYQGSEDTESGDVIDGG